MLKRFSLRRFTRHWLPIACWMAAGFLPFGVTRAETFIPLGATWRYLDNGSNQSNAWRTVEYEDDGWASGPAQLGYGDGDEATEVSYGTNSSAKYITTYFRHVFTVPDAAAVSNLVLRRIRDDGAIVYLNGVEVFRDNLPATGVTYTTRATNSIGGSDESEFVGTNIDPALLVSGANLLAVEIHQDSQSSSDISFDLELTDGRSDSPAVAITSPANNSVMAGSGDITISVAASDPNGSVTNVDLFAGNTLIGRGTNAPFVFVWSNVMAGAHIITAQARDDDGLISLSLPVKFLVGAGGATNLTLIPLSAAWRYLDDGSNQGTAWRQPAFDDGGWKSGFAQFGYGDGDEATLVSFGPVSTNKYVTTYFRQAFVVPDLAAVSTLVLRLLRDDGAVIYLNGTEVYRSNMPTGAVNYLTFASSSLSAPDEDTFVRATLNAAALQEGTNWLAVEIHQANRTSGDLGFNLELLGSDFPRVLRGPWLQTPTTTNIIVKWRTDVAVAGRVRFGLSPDNLSFVRNGSSATDHRIDLTNLAPGTKYYYSIGTASGPLLGGPEYSFTTMPVAGTRQKTRFWALGDCGTANVDQFNVRDAAYRALGTNALDFILFLGDNAYNAGTDTEYQRAIFETYPSVLRNTPVWSTIGNHETDQSHTPSSTIAYYQIFSLPRDGEAGGMASGTEDYYAFDYANIHFVCLDAMTSSRAANGTMANWLRSDLQSTTQEWIIAFWHHPPYTKGSHNSDSETELIEMRQNILPILESYGVDLVLCGHSHSYERTHLLNGHYGSSFSITPEMKLDTGGGRCDGAGAYHKPAGSAEGAVYVVAGSSGKISGGNLNHIAMFTSLNKLGSMLIEIEGDRLDATFLRENGLTNDYFSIVKGTAITIADASVTEPDTNTVSAAFTLTLSPSNASAVTVSFNTAPGTALAGMDFLGTTGNVTFAPGVTTQTIWVPIVGDLVPEADEQFSLNLFGSPLLRRTSAQATIFDNDAAAPGPQFASVRRSGSDVAFTWQTIPGAGYRIEFKDDLNQPQWQTLPDVIVGNGGVVTFTNGVVAAPQRFYRLRID